MLPPSNVLLISQYFVRPNQKPGILPGLWIYCWVLEGAGYQKIHTNGRNIQKGKAMIRKWKIDISIALLKWS